MLTSLSEIPSQPSAAVILLHGFGSDAEDLAGLIPPLKSTLGEELAQQIAFFSLQAPAPTRFGMGYQWFDDKGYTFNDRDGIAATHTQLGDFLQEKVWDELGIAPARTVLIGFSQGGMQVLFSGPRLSQTLGGVVSIAGKLMWAEELPVPPVATPRFLLLHGMEDDVVVADSSVFAAEAYTALGLNVEYELLPGLGHGIDGQALAHVTLFIQDILS
jgi:phospholipase/carboxylesterase